MRTCANSCWRSTPRSSARFRMCCGRNPVLRIARAGVIVALCAMSARATDQYRYTKELHATLTYSGGRVTIEHSFGGLEVRTTSGREVTVRGTVRSSDPELGNEIHFSTSNSSGGVMIRTVYPESMMHHCNCSF